MKHPVEHPLWAPFAEFAHQNNISLGHPDDWELWWLAFTSGAKAEEARRRLAEQNRQPPPLHADGFFDQDALEYTGD